MSDEKTCWLLVGPNGAGKTTLRTSDNGIHDMLWEDIDWILPDEIAKTLDPQSHFNVDGAASRIALREIKEHIKTGKSFATEATLSANYHINLARTLKKQGWKVNVAYIGLESPELSIRRVNDRVELGGHDVTEVYSNREKTLERRFLSSIKRLPKLIELSDQAYLFDNSTIEGLELLAVGSNGVLRETASNQGDKLSNVTQILKEKRMLVPHSWEKFLSDPATESPHKKAWFIAGPNGAGKSTFIGSPWSGALKNLPFINTDNIAREISPKSSQTAHFPAGKKALELVKENMNNDQSFVIETTLSGKTHLRLMKELKEKGWDVGMVYVSIDPIELSMQRIAHRVSEGGHNVPEDDVRRRWPRTARNAIEAIDIADTVHILDNTGGSYRHIGVGGKGVLTDLRSESITSTMMELFEKYKGFDTPKPEQQRAL